MKLQLADRFALPADFITQTAGILAVRGSGKTNLAAVIAEEMAAARLPFVVVDPVGAWWGLRSSSDGKGPGLRIKSQFLPLPNPPQPALFPLGVSDRGGSRPSGNRLGFPTFFPTLAAALVLGCADPVAPLPLSARCEEPQRWWSCQHNDAAGQVAVTAAGCALPSEMAALLAACLEGGPHP